MSNNNNTENSLKNEEKWYESTISITIIIIILWLLSLALFYDWNYHFSLFEEISKNGFTIINAKPADIGDTFNIFNSLIGAITIVLLFRTYKLQQQAFKKQSDELDATKGIFEKQKEEMEEQKRIMEEERFQNYLNFLFTQKERLGKEIYIELGDIVLNYQNDIFLQITKAYNAHGKEIIIADKKYPFSKIKSTIENWILDNQQKLGNYLSLIQSIEWFMKTHTNPDYRGISYISLTEAESKFTEIYLKVIHKYSIDNKNPPKP